MFVMGYPRATGAPLRGGLREVGQVGCDLKVDPMWIVRRRRRGRTSRIPLSSCAPGLGKPRLADGRCLSGPKLQPTMGRIDFLHGLRR